MRPTHPPGLFRKTLIIRNDDSTYYNIHIEDDTASNKVFGRAKAATTRSRPARI